MGRRGTAAPDSCSARSVKICYHNVAALRMGAAVILRHLLQKMKSQKQTHFMPGFAALFEERVTSLVPASPTLIRGVTVLASQPSREPRRPPSRFASTPLCSASAASRSRQRKKEQNKPTSCAESLSEITKRSQIIEENQGVSKIEPAPKAKFSGFACQIDPRTDGEPEVAAAGQRRRRSPPRPATRRGAPPRARSRRRDPRCCWSRRKSASARASDAPGGACASALQARRSAARSGTGSGASHRRETRPPSRAISSWPASSRRCRK